jgi:hypothetical protein
LRATGLETALRPDATVGFAERIDEPGGYRPSPAAAP